MDHTAPITPLRLPLEATSVLFFGGSFDPPHLAHAQIPPLVRDRRLGPGGYLIYVPAACSPHKEGGPVAPDADRLTMARLATRAVGRSLVWSDEIDRAAATGEPSYTIDTLRRARAVMPESVKLALLIGSDQATAFHRWREPREILALAEPVVMLRPPHASSADVLALLGGAAFWTEAELERWGGAIDAGVVMDVNSTAVRERLGTHDADVSALLDPRVLAYIQKQGLYRPLPSA